MTKFVCSCAVLLTAFAAGAATCVWTGNGGDYKWSTAENWDTLAVPVDGDNVTLIARRDGVADPTTIVNDIKGLTLNHLRLSGNGSEAASTNLTLIGETITLKRTSGSDYNLYIATYQPHWFINYCPLVFQESADGTGLKQGIYMGQGSLEQYGDVFSSATTFCLVRSSSPSATFHGTISAPQATLEFRGNCTWTFDKRVTADVLKFGNCGLPFSADGCSFREVRFIGGTRSSSSLKVACLSSLKDAKCFWDAADVLQPFAVSADLVIGGLSSVMATNGTGEVISNAMRVHDNNSNLSDNGRRTLTVCAEESAEAWVLLQYTLSLTYAPKGDYTLDLAGRVHTTKGALKVNGGTLRLTHGGCFPNVTEVTVEKGATFDVASKNASNASLSANARVVLATGAKLVVSNACDLTVKTLVYGGLPVAAKTYQAADCDWLEGEGKVTVTTTGGGATYWKSAASGKWTDADKWTDGVPTDTVPGYILADGDTDYTVTVDETVTAPKVFGLRSGGKGRACLEVAEGGKWLATGITDYWIGRNGTWLVDGGWASISNNVTISGFRFRVWGDEGATGAVKVTSGTFKLAQPDGTKIYIGRWGRIDATGGSTQILSSRRDQGSIGGGLRLAGGVATASGTAKWYVNNESHMGAHCLTLDDDVVYEGVSYYNVEAGNRANVPTSQFGVYANADNDANAFWDVKGNASINYAGGAFHVDSAGRGTCGTLRYSSTGRSPVQSGKTFCGRMIVGDGGCGRVYQSAGALYCGYLGVSVGGGIINTARLADGLLEVSGGVFDALGSVNADDGPGRLHGFAVGYGAYFDKSWTGRFWPFAGTVRVKDTGCVRLQKGYMTIGAGYGTGDWLQLGGVTTNQSSALSLGLAGGLGTLTMSGGVFRTTLTYLGGAPTNAFTMLQRNDAHPNAGAMLVPNGNYPIDRHAGVGTLTIAGGSFEAEYNAAAGVWMGLDGDGAIEMVGSKGAFTSKFLTATNLLAGAGTATAHQTESTLKFTFDKDGVSPLDVTGKATLTAGTKVVVDFSDYEGGERKFRLIRAGSLDCDLSGLDITIIDRNAATRGIPLSEQKLENDRKGNLVFRAGRKVVVLLLR